MGYQVGVTPLQMVTAVSAVANGGELVEPHLVRAVIRNGRRAETPRRVLRRAVAPDTAAVLTSMMESVVERGTAKGAQLESYRVAGKTGTAAKLVNGRYSTRDYNASFIGFVPSRRPALAVLVVIDSPRAKSYYAGTVAAPVFKRVAQAALRHLAVPPSVNPVPPVLVAPGGDVTTAAAQPARATAVLQASSVHVPREGLMPDLRGLSAREALRIAAQLGLSARLRGDGVVVKQSPEAGLPVDRGVSCELWLKRQLPAPADAAEKGVTP
jgi:membrane peptidoglycan carboxypeptidase